VLHHGYQTRGSPGCCITRPAATIVNHVYIVNTMRSFRRLGLPLIVFPCAAREPAHIIVGDHSPYNGGCPYCAGDKIEKNEMGAVCSAVGEGERRVLVGKHEGKRPLGRPRRKWKDNIRMDLQEMGCGGMNWIGLAHDRDRWRAIVNAVMNLRVQ
jgi:hypothetical protein